MLQTQEGQKNLNYLLPVESEIIPRIWMLCMLLKTLEQSNILPTALTITNLETYRALHGPSQAKSFVWCLGALVSLGQTKSYCGCRPSCRWHCSRTWLSSSSSNGCGVCVCVCVLWEWYMTPAVITESRGNEHMAWEQLINAHRPADQSPSLSLIPFF